MGVQKMSPKWKKYVLFNEVGKKFSKNKGLWYFFVNYTNHSS